MTAVALTLGMVTGLAAEPARAVAATALMVPPAGTETSARTSASLATEVRIRKVDGTFRRVRADGARVRIQVVGASTSCRWWRRSCRR